MISCHTAATRRSTRTSTECSFPVRLAASLLVFSAVFMICELTGRLPSTRRTASYLVPPPWISLWAVRIFKGLSRLTALITHHREWHISNIALSVHLSFLNCLWFKWIHLFGLIWVTETESFLFAQVACFLPGIMITPSTCGMFWKELGCLFCLAMRTVSADSECHLTARLFARHPGTAPYGCVGDFLVLSHL